MVLQDIKNMTNNIIVTFDLSKVYKLRGHKKEINALNKINLNIKEGEVFGLLGPNGAGKTTLIQILTTLLQPTNGYATIDGFNILKSPKNVKSRIGLMLCDEMLYYRITGYDNLKFFCKIYKIRDYKEKIIEIAKEFEFESWLNQYVENYSSGMKMKLALCRTLLSDPKILFLDEPTLGIDVRTISFIIKKLNEIKKTIFLTSHDMNVVEQLCDRIAFIDRGNILKIGTQADIKRLMQDEINIEIDINQNKTQLINELEKYGIIDKIKVTNTGVLVTLHERSLYSKLLSILSKYPIQMIKEQELSLGELFIKII